MRSFLWCSLFLVSSCAPVRPAEDPGRAVQVENMLFELCPRALSGALDLSDPGQLEQHGLVPAEREAGWIYARTAAGSGELLIGFQQFTNNSVCRLRFEGADNQAIVRHLLRTGAARGWRSSAGPGELGGFIAFLLPPGAQNRRIMFVHHPAHRDLPASSSAGMILDRP